MGDLFNFDRGQIVGVYLAGACDKNCHIIRCIKSNSFYGYVSIQKSWEDISNEEQWAKSNTDRKRASYIENDCFEISQNYCNTGDSRTEYSSWETIFIKTIQRELHKSNITVGLQLLNLSLLKVMIR
jgi:hypothetical protein